MALFTADELSQFVQDDVDVATALRIEQVVWGWLKPALGLAERPAQLDPQVYSWALELGAIAYENPAGLSQYQLGAERWSFSTERREQILADAAASTGAASGSQPRGSFPVALGWPDPIRL